MSSSESIRADGPQSPQVSLITTIRNEAESLPGLLESIQSQTLQPQEVIVVDGGSTDSSVEVLHSWLDRLPLKVVCAPGANISTGRNIALDHACCDLVAVTDAGVRLDPDWLEQLVAPLAQDLAPVDVVGGFFEPDPRTDFEVSLAASTLPDSEEISGETFLPSSRSLAFRKSWYVAGVRYPEWLDYCEDLIFDLRLKRAGARFAFQPAAIARFRPRRSVREYWRQYFHYARGDGKAGLFAKRHAVRYFTYLILLPSFFLVRSWGWRLVVLFGAAAYMRQPAIRLRKRSGKSLHRLIPDIARSAVLRGIGDVAKMTGYPVGLVWRARRYGLIKDWQTIPEDERDTSLR